MVEAIRNAHADVNVEAHTGSGGVFDVVIDGNKVYSKWDTGRFPANADIVTIINGLKAKTA
ncbi:MAG: SelT/SelW/SelH family protein [Planctomycetes bacterium]|nr:SelT/SelW/SelH family protein [Planctomycetota bacterium]